MNTTNNCKNLWVCSAHYISVFTKVSSDKSCCSDSAKSNCADTVINVAAVEFRFRADVLMYCTHRYTINLFVVVSSEWEKTVLTFSLKALKLVQQGGVALPSLVL